MKLLYFISKILRRINRALRWFSWAWVDSYAHNFIPEPLPDIWKTILFSMYSLIVVIFFGSIFYSIFVVPWLAIVLMAIGFFSMPILIEILNVPLKEESD